MQPAFFEADLVIKADSPKAAVMSVTKVHEDTRLVDCVWYEVNGRRTGTFSFADLQILAPSPLRHPHSGPSPLA